MYEFISANESKRYRHDCSKVLQKTGQILREKGINTTFYLVGSGARNMITRNGNGPYDLDYNIEIISANNIYWNDLGKMKETIRTALNEAEGKPFFQNVSIQNSTRVLTTVLHFNNTPEVEFSFDVAILARDNNGDLHQLNYDKTFSSPNHYIWNIRPDSRDISDKADLLRKDNQIWDEVRKCYLQKKNMYLKRQDNNHSSFKIYVEAVNEIYYKYADYLKRINPQPKKKTINISEFNNKILKILSKNKPCEGKKYSSISSLACKNYNGKASKQDVHTVLVQKFGENTGGRIYNLIKSELH